MKMHMFWLFEQPMLVGFDLNLAIDKSMKAPQAPTAGRKLELFGFLAFTKNPHQLISLFCAGNRPVRLC
jgi:hypothetical protein